MDGIDMIDEIMDYGQGLWLTFTADHDRVAAAAAFVKRYGVRPAHVGVDRRWKYATLKVGPVPDLEVIP